MFTKKIAEDTTEFLTFLIRARWVTKLTLQYHEATYYMRVFYFKDGRKKPFCFIDLETGDILGPGNLAGPDLHGPRGNIFSAEVGMEAVTPEGLKKLKVGKPKGFKHEEVIPRPSRKKKAPKVVHPTLIRVPAIIKPVVHGTLPVKVWTPASQED